MILFVIAVAIIVAFGIKEGGTTPENFLDKQSTVTVNGIFVLLIFLSHGSQYVVLSDGILDRLYVLFQTFHNQWVVTTFLTFSGYGVMLSIIHKGYSYVESIPKNRLLKTLVNFDLAVVLFLITDFLIGEHYDLVHILLSLIGLTSVGNSNWYIFSILVMYTATYAAARMTDRK